MRGRTATRQEHGYVNRMHGGGRGEARRGDARAALTLCISISRRIWSSLSSVRGAA
jgi:hypothetical protein